MVFEVTESMVSPHVRVLIIYPHRDTKPPTPLSESTHPQVGQLHVFQWELVHGVPLVGEVTGQHRLDGFVSNSDFVESLFGSFENSWVLLILGH